VYELCYQKWLYDRGLNVSLMPQPEPRFIHVVDTLHESLDRFEPIVIKMMQAIGYKASDFEYISHQSFEAASADSIIIYLGRSNKDFEQRSIEIFHPEIFQFDLAKKRVVWEALKSLKDIL
jgi:hypothetical protein